MRCRTEGSGALKADRRYTYRGWPEDERWELISGVAYGMSPAPRREHQGLAGLVYRSFANTLTKQGCKTYMSPIDLYFLTGDEDLDDAGTVVQPDGVPTRIFPEIVVRITQDEL
jgi:hypothetical protein